eukprot:m.259025 g.259025  ORF g.259025 m.259025 type:complete len:75 (+) comp26632_c1_seq1:3163-3387(+)
MAHVIGNDLEMKALPALPLATLNGCSVSHGDWRRLVTTGAGVCPGGMKQRTADGRGHETRDLPFTRCEMSTTAS